MRHNSDIISTMYTMKHSVLFIQRKVTILLEVTALCWGHHTCRARWNKLDQLLRIGNLPLSLSLSISQ